MGVEVEGSVLPKVNGDDNVDVHDNVENGETNVSEPITFGSHGVDEEQSSVGEVKSVSNTNLPKDAVDEWPAEPQVHSFWIVKYRPYEDPKLKAEMDALDKDIQKKITQISQIYDDINPKRAEKEELHAILSTLGEEKSQYQEFIDQKRKEMKPLQDALGDLRGPGREKGVAICSSEEELNAIIRSMEYRIQHESVTLKEEKQILRDIKEFEATRPKVVANAAMRAKVQESMGQKEAIQDQVKLLGTDLDGVRKQKAAVQAKRDQLHAQVNVLKDQITKLYTDVKILKEKKQASLEAMQELRKKRDTGNTDYYKNRTIISNVKDLAAKKDVKALEELVNTEVENFMSQWNSNKAFRSNYEKRILLSLDMRQLSRDGRMRNFDEKPLVKPESSVPSEAATVPKAASKPQKEAPKAAPKTENLPAETETKKKGNKEAKAILERSMEEDVFVVEKPKKNVSNGNEIDAAKLKEMKKEEEKEKQRQALERKKKLQEKAAAKAALRAQKEAEKKQKDREKKLKKKGSSSQATDEEEASEKTDVDEVEKSTNVEDDATVTTAAPPKAKEQKETALRHRKTVKSRGTLPKAILKKKKSTDYWVWASAGAAAVVVLVLLFLGYNYVQKAQVVD